MIDLLTATPSEVKVGEISLVEWVWACDDVEQVLLTRTDPKGVFVHLREGKDVPNKGSAEEKLPVAGTFTYTLHLEIEGGILVEKSVFVIVAE